MQKVKEKEKLLKIYNLPRLNQEGIEHINRLITSNAIISVVKLLLKNNNPGPDCLKGKSYQTFREELTSINSKYLAIQNIPKN